MIDHPTSLTLTVEEAAALLGVSRSTAYAMAAQEQLPTIRLRRRILVPAALLADLLGVSILELRVYARRQLPRSTHEAPIRTIQSPSGPQSDSPARKAGPELER